MAKLMDTEFVDISVTVFNRITGPLPFDVYIRRASDAFTKLFPRGEVVDRGRLMNYKSAKGVNNLFVQRLDYKQYLLYVERVAAQILAKGSEASVEEVLEILKEMTRLTVVEIMIDHHLDPVALSHAGQVVQGCLELLGKDPKTLLKIFRLMTAHPYMVRHAIATAVFALLTSTGLALESEKSLTIVGMGALLHDIGASMLPFDPEDKSELTPQEWREIKEHPQLGRRMLEEVKAISPEVRSVVLQHHEQPNGSGYPNGLHDRQIYALAKIVSVADGFSALISRRPFRADPCAPAHAIELMREDRGKYDPAVLDQLAAIFILVRAA